MPGRVSSLTIAVTIFFVLTTACNRNMPAKTEVAHPVQQEKEQPQVPPKTIVKLRTTMGDISIELFTGQSPITCGNFLKYVEDGFYNDTIFHRVIPDFMIQGGGLTADMKEKPALAPIKNEASNRLGNLRGTIAMARTADPDSATCQFFINHGDNSRLNYVSSQNQGYAVFGKVAGGMDVVDRIAQVKTTDKGPHANVPVEPVIIKSASLIKQNSTP